MGAGRQNSRRPQGAGRDRRGHGAGQHLAARVAATAPRPEEKSGAELLYGRHAVLEALRAGRRRIHRIFLGESIGQAGIVAEIVAAARIRGCPVAVAPQPLLESISPVNHQGVVAEAEPYCYVNFDDLLTATNNNPIYLVLDHLQDVQNLGTLLRTAEAMAASGVILPERRAAGITPAAVNASAGAVEHLPVAQVINLAQTLERLKAAGVWVVGLDAGPGAIPLSQADLTGPLALVVGAEGAGLARLVRERCDWLLAIPMHGKVSSLNAAVAGSVVLVAAREARSSKRPVKDS